MEAIQRPNHLRPHVSRLQTDETDIIHFTKVKDMKMSFIKSGRIGRMIKLPG